MINKFFTSDRLHIPHKFLIIGERQMTIRLNVRDINCHWNITHSPVIEQATPELQKSDDLPIDIAYDWSFGRMINDTDMETLPVICYHDKMLMLVSQQHRTWSDCKQISILVAKANHFRSSKVRVKDTKIILSVRRQLNSCTF